MLVLNAGSHEQAAPCARAKGRITCRRHRVLVLASVLVIIDIVLYTLVGLVCYIHKFNMDCVLIDCISDL